MKLREDRNGNLTQANENGTSFGIIGNCTVVKNGTQRIK